MMNWVEIKIENEERASFAAIQSLKESRLAR